MSLIELFKKRKKEKDAYRLNRIARSINIHEKMENIVDHEYRNMLFKAEEAALNGETSIEYTLNIPENNVIYINRIVYMFIDRLTDNGFSYSKHYGTKKVAKFNIHFNKRQDTI